MKKTKHIILISVYALLIAIIIWCFISNIIQAFICPEMTQTELFLHIPKSFICDWQFSN